MEEIYEFIKSCETYYLSTVEDGRPKLRPFGTIDFFGGKIYFLTDRTKNVSRQIALNPSIEICCMYGGKWLRLTALAAEDDRMEPLRHMLDAFPFLREKYSENDGICQVFYLTYALAEIYKFTEVVKSVSFE